MTSRFVPVLFAVTVLSVPVQLGVAKLVSEPYPGLFLPAFGTIPPEPGVREVGQRAVTVDYADGTSEDYTADDLFPDVELEGRMLDFTFYGERGQDPGSRAWLARRVEELGGRGPAERVELRWTRAAFSTTTDAPPVIRPEKTVVVDLLPPAGAP